ncbi:hypothetical protein AMJ80_04540 [bacterium SM23_31]|nr:MAG: hypothetical protein AMJ80_04540 [bacterium SM23_31]
MKIQHSKIKVTLIVILILYTFSCSESLPPYEEPEVIFEYNFYLIGNQAWIPYPQNFPVLTRFTFDFRHLFDETLTGEYYRRGYIDIWLVDNPAVKKHFEFLNYNPKINSILDPGEWYNYRYFWDQTFDDGSILYEHLSSIPIAPSPGNPDAPPPPPVSINLKAKGEIQILKEYNKAVFDEIEFTVYYYIPPPGKVSDKNDISGKKH